jgi:hypothetical protein
MASGNGGNTRIDSPIKLPKHVVVNDQLTCARESMSELENLIDELTDNKHDVGHSIPTAGSPMFIYVYDGLAEELNVMSSRIQTATKVLRELLL